MNQTKTMLHPAFKKERTLVEEYLSTLVSGKQKTLDLPDNLAEAMNYSLLAGGKRLRPVLVMLCARIASENEEQTTQKALPPAAALEMIHCFSLIHDDLPAMDDDDLRRGKPTNHKKYSEAMAILAGDGLATLPYLVITKSNALSVKQKAILSEQLAEATMQMIAGQVYDTMGGFDKNTSPEQDLELTHRNKTGALIRAACRLGVMAANHNNEINVDTLLTPLTQYGETIGLMFQIVDDVLDVTQTTEQLGKAANKDADAGKLTYPTIFGLEQSQQFINEYAQKANALLDTLNKGKAVEPLRNLVSYLSTRTK